MNEERKLYEKKKERRAYFQNGLEKKSGEEEDGCTNLRIIQMESRSLFFSLSFFHLDFFFHFAKPKSKCFSFFIKRFAMHDEFWSFLMLSVITRVCVFMLLLSYSSSSKRKVDFSFSCEMEFHHRFFSSSFSIPF